MMDTDAGRYTNAVTNIGGSHQASGNLIVRGENLNLRTNLFTLSSDFKHVIKETMKCVCVLLLVIEVRFYKYYVYQYTHETESEPVCVQMLPKVPFLQVTRCRYFGRHAMLPKTRTA